VKGEKGVVSLHVTISCSLGDGVAVAAVVRYKYSSVEAEGDEKKNEGIASSPNPNEIRTRPVIHGKGEMVNECSRNLTANKDREKGKIFFRGDGKEIRLLFQEKCGRSVGRGPKEGGGGSKE
jgi:hypothetical protein